MNGRAFSPRITDAADIQGLQPWLGDRMAFQAEGAEIAGFRTLEAWPLEVMDRGETDRIWSMIFFLRSGMPV